ncbi:MAG TPA: 30S ribosome-binding factor RbfA [Candidatus Dormibacteraeota bacterium]|jgi:ribosome-binding factor A|nr:30S ribosome-binding factor RbfA [Candidatus Dormibacteraeota bacterium]
MPYKRTDRVNALIRHELQQLIQQEVKDPRVGFATVTDVETSPDLRHARVYVSVMGDDAEADATVKALQEAKAFLRHELAGRITMRRVPDLDFMRDTTLDRAMRIEALLREAKGREQE